MSFFYTPEIMDFIWPSDTCDGYDTFSWEGVPRKGIDDFWGEFGSSALSFNKAFKALILYMTITCSTQMSPQYMLLRIFYL